MKRNETQSNQTKRTKRNEAKQNQPSEQNETKRSETNETTWSKRIETNETKLNRTNETNETKKWNFDKFSENFSKNLVFYFSRAHFRKDHFLIHDHFKNSTEKSIQCRKACTHHTSCGCRSILGINVSQGSSLEILRTWTLGTPWDTLVPGTLLATHELYIFCHVLISPPYNDIVNI